MQLACDQNWSVLCPYGTMQNKSTSDVNPYSTDENLYLYLNSGPRLTLRKALAYIWDSNKSNRLLSNETGYSYVVGDYYLV